MDFNDIETVKQEKKVKKPVKKKYIFNRYKKTNSKDIIPDYGLICRRISEYVNYLLDLREERDKWDNWYLEKLLYLSKIIQGDVDTIKDLHVILINKTIEEKVFDEPFAISIIDREIRGEGYYIRAKRFIVKGNTMSFVLDLPTPIIKYDVLDVKRYIHYQRLKTILKKRKYEEQ